MKINYEDWDTVNSDRQYIYKRDNLEEKYKETEEKMKNVQETLQKIRNNDTNSTLFDNNNNDYNMTSLYNSTFGNNSNFDEQYQQTLDDTEKTVKTIFKIGLIGSLIVIILNILIIGCIIWAIVHCIKKHNHKGGKSGNDLKLSSPNVSTVEPQPFPPLNSQIYPPTSQAYTPSAPMYPPSSQIYPSTTTQGYSTTITSPVYPSTDDITLTPYPPKTV